MVAHVPFIPRLELQGDPPHSHVWAIVLTGDAPPVPGRGNRPRPHRPARWPLGSTTARRSRAQRALERASCLAPSGQLVTVMTRRHAAAWQRELTDLPPGLPVVQPVYRGRAADVLLPVLKVARRDPSATVIVLPAAQRVDHDARFLRYVSRAVWAVAMRPDVPLLIGAHPYAPVADGWIEPGEPVEGLEPLAVRAVKRFVDDASPAESRHLFESNALMSTSILVARASTLLLLAARALPEVLEALEPLDDAFDRPEESLLCEAIYECMPRVGLAAVERDPELAVLTLPDVVWQAPEPEDSFELLAS